MSVLQCNIVINLKEINKERLVHYRNKINNNNLPTKIWLGNPLCDIVC